MKVELKTITPTDAAKMLELNTSNRPANFHHVKRLASQMTAGRWRVNGDTICMNGSCLIDGQHRLLAIIESGCTIETLVVEGISSDAFNTKDIGKRRSAADTLAVNGEVSCKSLAATLTTIDRYMTNRMDRKVRYENNEVEELLKKYPGARKSVNVCRSTKGLVQPSILSACHFLFSQKDEDAANEFIDGVLHGRNLSEGDPEYTLRERLLKNSLSSSKMAPMSIAAIIIKAWNAKRLGAKIKMLRFFEAGDKPEAFPVVQ
ncbi:MAG: hypothetical protein ACO3RQ_08600 [Litorivicinaceae bacterium]